MSPNEEREIRDYVLSQRPAFDMAGEDVELVQRVGRRRISGTTYLIYDVHMSGGSRWWVITNHTNLYSQGDLKCIDDALTHHIGLMSVSAEQFRQGFDDEHVAPPLKAYRRYSRAVSSLAEAEEPEEFQAVGIKCRDAMIAFGEAYVGEPWVKVPDGIDRPKGADAKGWLRIYADCLCSSRRQRDYVRHLTEKTWDITVALQHDSNATEWDAEIVLAATHTIFRTFSLLLTKERHKDSPRCPECDSYRLAEEADSELAMDAGRVGVHIWTVCESCDWESEKEWDSWDAERLRRMAAYASGEWSPPKRSMDELDPGDEADDCGDDRSESPAEPDPEGQVP